MCPLRARYECRALNAKRLAQCSGWNRAEECFWARQQPVLALGLAGMGSVCLRGCVAATESEEETRGKKWSGREGLVGPSGGKGDPVPKARVFCIILKACILFGVGERMEAQDRQGGCGAVADMGGVDTWPVVPR